MRQIELDNYQDDEVVREVADAFLVVNRNIQANTLDEDSTPEQIQFAKDFSEYMGKELERIAPKFWETIKHND